MTPLFLTGTQGRLFAIRHQPDASQGTAIVFLPSGFEENNRSRHMVARQAREFRAQGHDCLLLDYYGTGDSDGEYGQARLDIWREDVVRVCDWLRDDGCERILLWGLRLGALLACDIARSADAEGLILWSPTPSGGRFLDQWLRVAVASGLDQAGGKTSVSQLRTQLNGGETIEVGGYEISPHLAAQLDDLALKVINPRPCWVEWIDVTPNAQPNFASQSIGQTWQEAGLDVSLNAVTGPPFWSLMEPEWAPELTAMTTRRLGRRIGG